MRLAGSGAAARYDASGRRERGDVVVARRTVTSARGTGPREQFTADNSTRRGWGGDPCTNITATALAALGRVHLEVRCG